jgi:tRNA (guanine37-N1)-methyltransferase
MRIDVLTLFPGFFQSPLDSSILARARKAGAIDVVLTDIRDFTVGKHRKADDTPYGGGAGMVMKPDPVFAAVESLPAPSGRRVLFTCPQGRPYDQAMATELAGCEHIVILCGHYEGMDERVRQNLVTDEVSLGDFVLTGGEIPALAIIDSVARLLPGVLGNEASLDQESFTTGLLDYPHYTRPPDFRGWGVPEVLTSGDHAKIDRWRRQQALLRTHHRRPDLLEKADLSKLDRKLLKEALEAEAAPTTSEEGTP